MIYLKKKKEKINKSEQLNIEQLKKELNEKVTLAMLDHSRLGSHRYDNYSDMTTYSVETGKVEIDIQKDWESEGNKFRGSIYSGEKEIGFIREIENKLDVSTYRNVENLKKVRDSLDQLTGLKEKHSELVNNGVVDEATNVKRFEEKHTKSKERTIEQYKVEKEISENSQKIKEKFQKYKNGEIVLQKQTEKNINTADIENTL